MRASASVWLIAAAALLGLAVVTHRWQQQPPRPPQEPPLQADVRLPYKQVGQHVLLLHVFKPPATAQHAQTAALLMFHGGAWQHGDPSQFFPQCRQWAQRGITCISADYRTSQVHGSTPADALQDARDAMRHLRRNATTLGIDPQRIGAGGGSAGGHLAAALATGVPWPDPHADPLAPTRPDALVLFNPMLDLAPGMPDHGLVGAQWLALSPHQHVGPGMPPTLVLNGSADAEVAVATVQAFCSAVQAHGGNCQLLVYAGAGHGFFNPGADGDHHPQSTRDVADFLLRLGWLRPTPQ